jgi:hypothetical protein
MDIQSSSLQPTYGKGQTLSLVLVHIFNFSTAKCRRKTKQKRIYQIAWFVTSCWCSKRDLTHVQRELTHVGYTERELTHVVSGLFT